MGGAGARARQPQPPAPGHLGTRQWEVADRAPSLPRTRVPMALLTPARHEAWLLSSFQKLQGFHKLQQPPSHLA